MATVEVFAPSGPRLDPRSGLGERTVRGRSLNIASLPRLTNWMFDRYFCEPAYEKFRGTSEGALNSRLYNEKAYVLSRGFILRALEKPPGSLEGEVRRFYLSPPPSEGVMGQDQGCAEGTGRGGSGGHRRLDKVLKDTQNLISFSQALEQRSRARSSPSLNQGQQPPGDGLTGSLSVADEDAAVPSLTAGGILTLKRILSKLLNIQPNHSRRSLETTPTSN